MKTICIVEDDLKVQTFFNRVLGEEYKILSAASAREAIHHFVHEPSLYVIDRHLPEVNGLDLIKLIRLIFPTVPIALITNGIYCEIAIEMGATACIEPGFTPNQVKDLIADLLK